MSRSSHISSVLFVVRGCTTEDPFSKKKGERCKLTSEGTDKVAQADCEEVSTAAAQPVCEFGTSCFGGCNKCTQDSDCLQDKPSARTCDTNPRSRTLGFCTSVVGDVCQIRGKLNNRGASSRCPEGSKCKPVKPLAGKPPTYGICTAQKLVGKSGCKVGETDCPDDRMCKTVGSTSFCAMFFGEPCNSGNKPCEPGHKCSKGKCAYDMADAANIVKDANNKAVVKKTTGTICKASSDCLSKVCGEMTVMGSIKELMDEKDKREEKVQPEKGTWGGEHSAAQRNAAQPFFRPLFFWLHMVGKWDSIFLS